MKKQAITILVLVILLLTVVAGASANPAYVGQIPEEESCLVVWYNTAGNLVGIPANGGVIVNTNSETGVSNLICRATVDFSQPGLLSFAEVCTLLPGACQGNVAFFTAETTGLSCFVGDTPTTDYMATYTGSGVVRLHCKVGPNG